MNIKQFFATLIGSFIGVWSAIILFSVFTIISMVIFIAAFSMKSAKTFTTEKDSVLYLNLSGSIPERTAEEDIFTSLFNDEVKGSSLVDILESIEYAKNDRNIKGIYIDCNVSVGGLASLYEIRKALEDFKKSGKWIYAYGNFIEQGDYYVASVSDSIYLNPVGVANIRGLCTTTPYFKNMLDKLGIEMQIIKVGTFKSAVEPYILTEMSEADRLQKEVYLGSMWHTVSSAISKSRNITLSKLNMLADSMLLTKSPSFLLKNRIIDGTCYKNEFTDKLKKLTGLDESDDLRLVAPSDLVLAARASGNSAKAKIAVIYAVGEINSADKDGIVADEIVDDVLDLAKDDNIKGLVMRVNSPGGSAFDSEQIWAALEEFKASGKPYAVSMGNVAASGGYYISCGADRIFAEPLTLTGSIGIFGMIPCFKDLMQDKIGINTSYVMTNENGNFPSVMRKMTPAQAAAMQHMVNDGYEMFTRRCAEGREIPVDSIKAIGGGRVWDGLSALKLGLVDELGGMRDAIEWVASRADIEDYSITVLPAEKNMFTRYFSKYVVAGIQKVFAPSGADEIFKYKDEIDKILNLDPVQCRMEPVEIN